MKQYKSLKGKPGYAFYNVFVISSLVISDPEVSKLLIGYLPGWNVPNKYEYPPFWSDTL